MGQRQHHLQRASATTRGAQSGRCAHLGAALHSCLDRFGSANGSFYGGPFFPFDEGFHEQRLYRWPLPGAVKGIRSAKSYSHISNIDQVMIVTGAREHAVREGSLAL